MLRSWSRLLPWLGGIEQTDPLIYPPWQAEDPRTSQNICPIRDGAGVAFQQWADPCPPLSMCLFTNGSRLSNSDTVADAGWYEHWGAWNQESARGHLSLPQHEVFDAEATAAYEGLKATFDSAQAPYTQNLYILLDNQEVARQLVGSPRGSSQSTILAFQEITNASPNRPLRCEAIPPGRVHVRWIPGHAGITGNEQVDEQAKKGARSTPQTNPPPVSNIAIAPSTWINDPMSYPFPELPSVASSLPGQGMETSPNTTSASNMMMPYYPAHVAAERSLSTSISAERVAKQRHIHGANSQ